MSAINELGAAAHRKMRAQEELAAANLALAAALAGLHLDGTPKRQVGSTARARLALHGFEDAQISRLGLSDGNVRVILSRLL